MPFTVAMESDMADVITFPTSINKPALSAGLENALGAVSNMNCDNFGHEIDSALISFDSAASHLHLAAKCAVKESDIKRCLSLAAKADYMASVIRIYLKGKRT
jgi:hypothetical protein